MTLLTTTLLDHSDHIPTTAAVAKAKGRLQCYMCGEKGHHSANCPNKKKHLKASAQLVKARAGATSLAQLGVYDKDESFDKEIDV
jgi:hypothetical protein